MSDIKTTKVRQHPARAIVLDRELRPRRTGAAKFDAIMRALRRTGFVLAAGAILVELGGLIWPVPEMPVFVIFVIGALMFSAGLMGLSDA